MNEFLTNAAEPGPAGGMQAAIVPASAAGERFDKVVAELFPDYSRSRLAAWIREGALSLDGRLARPRDAVRGGERVELRAPVEFATSAEAQDIALAVLYEDADLFVIDKAAGLVVHAGAGNPTGTLVNALLHRDPALAQLPRRAIT